MTPFQGISTATLERGARLFLSCNRCQSVGRKVSLILLRSSIYRSVASNAKQSDPTNCGAMEQGWHFSLSLQTTECNPKHCIINGEYGVSTVYKREQNNPLQHYTIADY